MPFGIYFAPEIYETHMHELIEGLTGIEVIADYFVVVGWGHSEAEAIHDYDKNLQALLQWCEVWGVRLNTEKLKLRMHEVPFIGHRATDEGRYVDPAKVQVIKEMPTPKDVALLGLTQNLSKFLPHLSNIVLELTQKEMAWVWDHSQQNALEELKQAVMSTPVLWYYNINEEVNLQYDASSQD